MCAQSTARERGLSAHGDSIDKGVPGRGGARGEETAAGEGRALFTFDPGNVRAGRYNHLVLARSQIQEVFPLAACPWLAENSRLGFRLVGSTLHQGPQPFKYLNGVGDTTSVVWNSWPESLKAQQQTAQGLAAQIPGQVKTAIMNSVNASNAPSGADTTGGFHEEGGIAGTNTNGGLVISPATPGAYSSSGVVSTSLTPADPALAGSITNLTVSWHVHPDGRTASGDLAWNQAPSGQDQKVAAAEHQALPGLIHIVVGAGNKQVYFYNGSSTVLQMSLKKFMAGAQ